MSKLNELLDRYQAQHTEGCPKRQEAYWEIRPEYKPKNWIPKPCSCGLDNLKKANLDVC